MNEETASRRLISLDAFRGLTILLMFLVNNMALDTATPPQFLHAAWNKGVHVADMVFPWFLFCVGVSIPFSSSGFHKEGVPPLPRRYVLRILRRTAALIFLGCLIDSSIAHHPVFSLDVLQLIGLAYMAGAFLYGLPAWRRLLVASFLLAGYCAAIKFIPVPGVGTGVFEEERNLIKYLNVTYLNTVHLRGLPSVVPTAALVLIGTVSGDIFRKKDAPAPWKMTWLVVSGIVLVACGMLWNASLPFNKTVWTPSYILLTAGFAMLVLAFFYFFMDVKGWRMLARPLLFFGSNAILAYVAPILVKVLILQMWQVKNAAGKVVSLQQWLMDACFTHAGRIAGGWLYTIAYIFFWWMILWIFYKRKIFLKV